MLTVGAYASGEYFVSSDSGVTWACAGYDVKFTINTVTCEPVWSTAVGGTNNDGTTVWINDISSVSRRLTSNLNKRTLTKQLPARTKVVKLNRRTLITALPEKSPTIKLPKRTLTIVR
jgi:hypothetical protein